MNIYDFDYTIYDGDSCKDIVLYGLKKHPFKTLKSLIKTNSLNKKYKKGLISFDIVKESLLSFIFKINNYEEFVNSFVNTHIHKMKPWYLERKTKNDVIVSASYDLWINKFAHELDIKYAIATKVDSKGKIIGKNCKREEKVRRIKELIGNKKIISAYSDSKADIPMLELTNNSYVVEGNKIYKYKRGYKFKYIK